MGILQKIKKAISDKDDDEGSVFDVLSIEELEDFKAALELYGLNRLTSFYDAIQGALDVLIQMDQASEEADLYETLYEPYYAKLEACQIEIDKRSATIEDLENDYETLDTRKKEIQKVLNFEEYLGKDLYHLFCSYRREDKYTNENYISDGLDNAEIFDNARKFIKVAQEELQKAATPKHSISSSLYNLMLIPEFEPLIDKFELGNWLRIRVDEDIYRLRLISYEINFSDIQMLSVEFSDITKQAGLMSDIEDILSSAQSMASSYNYVSKQAEKGEETYKTFWQMQAEGWNSALAQINNNVNEEITINEYGLWAKSYDDEIDDYSPEQARWTHNILCLTDDNWKTVKTALGKHDYYKYDVNKNLVKDTGYGFTTQFVNAGYINSSQMISGEIFSTKYKPKTQGTYFNLNEGDFQLAGGKFLFDSSTNILSIRDVVLDWDTTTKPGIGHVIGLTDELNGLSTRITVNADSITSEVTRAKNAETTLSSKITQNAEEISLRVEKGSVISSINQTAEQITISASKISLEGIVTANNYFKILTDGSMEATNATISGNITATSGKIANFTINGGYLFNGLGIGVEKSCGISCGSSLSGSDDWIFWAGNGVFRVDINGGLYTSNITATGGTFNNVTVEGNSTFKGTLSGASGNFSGTITTNDITATGGSIGGIGISSTGLSYSGSSASDGFGLWKNGVHAHNGSHIIMHAGGNGANIGGAAFRVYQNGSVVCSNLSVTGGSISVGNFSMDSSGNVTANALTANNANISGVLSAGTGSSLGGFKTDSNSIYHGSWGSTPPNVFMCTGSSTSYSLGGSGQINGWCFGAGSTFGVTNTGAVYATSGKIGGWTLSSDSLKITSLGTTSGKLVTLSAHGITIHTGSSSSSTSTTVSWQDVVNACK